MQAQPSVAHGGDVGRGERHRAGERSLGHPALHLPAAGAVRAAGATSLPMTDLGGPVQHPHGKEQKTLEWLGFALEPRTLRWGRDYYY